MTTFSNGRPVFQSATSFHKLFSLRVSLFSPLWDIFLHLEHGMFAYIPLITYSLDYFFSTSTNRFFCPWLKQVDGNLSSQVCVGASSFGLFG